MNETRVRVNEWNEALCFSTPAYPQIEVAVQKCRDHWNIFYVSSKSSLTIHGGVHSQKDAESLGRNVAEAIFEARSPIQEARRRAGFKLYNW